MKLDIHHIPSQGLVLDFDRPAGHFPSLKAIMEKDGCEFPDPLTFHLEVLPIKDLIRVKGHLKTTVRQTCARCLKIYPMPLHARFTLNYSREIPKDVHKTDTEGIELTADQIGMVFFEGEEIDFSDALQEQVILAMPFRPVCTKDCMGLCPRCGHDLNTGACQCDQKKPDGPFAVLRHMKLPETK